MKAECCERTATIQRYFERGLEALELASMREHLVTCARCRSHYNRWALLESLDPEARGLKRRFARDLGIGVDEPAGIRPWRARWTAVAGGLALAAAVLLFVGMRGASLEGFRGRGAPASESACAIFVYASEGGHPPRLVAGESIPKSSELAFAYENRCGKKRLLIFGADEHRHVYWYYPAWTDPRSEPVAIPIAQGAARVELPEAISHPFDGERLRIYGVFVDEAAKVGEIEALVAKAPPLAETVQVPRAIETSLAFWLR